GPERKPPTEAVFTTCADSPRASHRGTNARQPFTTPYRFTPSSQSQSSLRNSWIAPPCATPALLNRTSAVPKRSNAASASASRSPGSVTSLRTAIAGVPAASSSRASFCAGASSTSASTTRMPCSAHARAMPAPIPLAPPVTTATRPERSSMPGPPARPIIASLAAVRTMLCAVVDEPQRVFVTRDIPEASLRRLAGGLPGARIDVHRAPEPLAASELARAARGASALVCTLADRIDAALLEALAPPLRVVATFAVGYENIDLEAARRLGVRVANTPGVLTDATAEIAVALALACARRVAEGDRFVRAGRFAGWGPLAHLGHAVYGSTVGIVGA